MTKIRTNNHVVFQCSYRVVWCTKYRRDVLTPDVQERLKDIISGIAGERDAVIESIEVKDDQVHLLVNIDPQFGIHRLVKQFKGKSSRILRDEFPSVKSRLPSLWTNSYYVGTTGGTQSDDIKRYIENQKSV